MEAEFDLRKTDLTLGGNRGFSIGSGGRWRHITAAIKHHGKKPNVHIDFKPNFFAVNFCLRGKGVYKDCDGTEYAIRPGVLFHRLPNRLHTTIFEPESDFVEFFVVLDIDTVAHLHRLGLVSDVPVLEVGVQQSIVDELEDLIKTLRSTTSEVPSPLAVVRVLAFIQSLYERARQKRLQSYWERIVSDACSMLERNVEERVSMEEIAAKLGVSYTSFRKHFRRITSSSPGDYRVQYRIDRAKDLLTTRSVKQVAAELGYCDPFTFSAQFKTVTGVSPRQFQKTYRTGGKS
jgi:AraC family transcriptional regulator, arabinose operon regulatory protein